MIAMKRYLINGVLALLAGAFVGSCSEKEVEYVPLATQKAQSYEQVFKEVYGDNIDPEQNWGFSDEIVLADEDSAEIVINEQKASSNAGTRRARTRGHDANANMWGYTWSNVPAPLTDEQKKRVRLYFQYNKEPDNEAINYRNFFVQDVYKGGDNPLNKGEWKYRDYSTESYDQVGVGSEHMDYLTAGSDNDHINNYNNAHCSTNDNVWDGKTYEEGYPLTAETAAAKGIGDWEAENRNHIVFHSDEIMLMVDSKTDCFGFWDSNGSEQHNDRYVIVSGETIDRWAENQWVKPGASVSGRYFVGFDYDSGSTAKAWTNEYYSFDYLGLIKVRYLSANMNQYATTDVKRYNNQPDLLTLAWLYFHGYNPVQGSAEKVWAKVGSYSDGYYSDWIISVLEAQSKTMTSRIAEYPDVVEKKRKVESQSGRIFCEDLGVSSREDLDFNDVVFDVIVYKNWTETTTARKKIYSDGSSEDLEAAYSSTEDQATYSAKITILAAGGTIPLLVAGKEVHEAFGVGETTMVNTVDNNSTAFGSPATKDPVDIGEFTTSQLFPGEKVDTDPIYAIDIPIVVNYSTPQVGVLGASLGGVPSKVMVPFNTKWTVERKPLALAYPDFASYVTDKSVEWWNGPSDETELNRATYYRYNDIDPRGLADEPSIVYNVTHYDAIYEDVMWDAGQTYTSQWSLANLNLGIDTYYPGDRIRFYGAGLSENSYISVVFSDGSTPYFIDRKFVEPTKDESGNYVYPSTAIIEVLLDEDKAAKLNTTVQATGTIQVQGQNFTLTQITRVPFE